MERTVRGTRDEGRWTSEGESTERALTSEARAREREKAVVPFGVVHLSRSSQALPKQPGAAEFMACTGLLLLNAVGLERSAHLTSQGRDPVRLFGFESAGGPSLGRFAAREASYLLWKRLAWHCITVRPGRARRARRPEHGGCVSSSCDFRPSLARSSEPQTSVPGQTTLEETDVGCEAASGPEGKNSVGELGCCL